MRLDLQQPITETELRQSIVLFALLAIIVSIPFVWLAPPQRFAQFRLALFLASGLFWLGLTLLAFRHFWDVYYRFIYPQWMRGLGMVNFILYGLLALGIGYLIGDKARNPFLLFIGLGGIEGVLEHIVGIYLLGILKKVPWLHGLRAGPVLLFSFVEYCGYWALALWLAMGIQVLLHATGYPIPGISIPSSMGMAERLSF